MSVYTAELVTRRAPAFWIVASLKATLVALLLLPLLNAGWEQYDDKGMHWRILVFPLAGLVVPILWRAAGARSPYPHLADALLVTVPLADVLWNTFDAYDRLWWWDDMNHLLNSILIAYAIGLWLTRYPLGPVVRLFLVLGVGMTLAVGWELAEYPTFLNDSPELATAYRDTLGNLRLALIGSAFSAVLAAHWGEEEPLPAVAAEQALEPEPACT